MKESLKKDNSVDGTNTSYNPTPNLSLSSDEAYLKAQDADSSWNHLSHLGTHSAMRLVQFGNILKWTGNSLGTFADFGGNDGFAASAFEDAHGVAPTVLDCSTSRLEYADETYGLPTVRCFLEDIPVKDNAFDYGFCSHVAEHFRDPTRAIKEIIRVVRNMVYFVIPVELDYEFKGNDAHMTFFESGPQCREFLMSNGFKDVVMLSLPNEAHLFARC